jgi:hypothetical protein
MNMSQPKSNSEIAREMVRDENDFINHRFTWLAAFQGLLFAALAFAWGKQNTDGLVIIFCVIGGLVALSIGIAMYRSNKAIDYLDKWWDTNTSEGYNGPDIEGVRSSSGLFWWLMPGQFIPWVFLISWVFVLCVHLK